MATHADIVKCFRKNLSIQVPVNAQRDNSNIKHLLENFEYQYYMPDKYQAYAILKNYQDSHKYYGNRHYGILNKKTGEQSNYYDLYIYQTRENQNAQMLILEARLLEDVFVISGNEDYLKDLILLTTDNVYDKPIDFMKSINAEIAIYVSSSDSRHEEDFNRDKQSQDRCDRSSICRIN